MKLENWAIVSDPYKAPEIRDMFLSGNVYGHYKRLDGESIRTSKIIGKTNTGKIVTYSRNVYELGVPNIDYEQLFPDCLNRLLKFADIISFCHHA